MEKETYELTYPQKNIWFVDKFNGNTAINNIAGSISISKDFDIEICKKAINEFIKINDATRMRILENSDSTKQYVEKYNKFDVEMFDFSNETEEKITEFENIVSSESIRNKNGSLLYFMIIKQKDNKGKIYAKLHHTICDAWSMSLLITEICEIYDNIRYNKGLDLSENKPSYIDYILSEKEYVDSEKMKKDEEFFKEYLNECPKPIDIKERKIVNDLTARRYTKFLEKKVNEEINEFCKENKISPYVLFFTALAVYIKRIKETDDFILGTPILNRSNFKEKQMLGMFVSTIPVRFKIDEEKTFLEICLGLAKDNMSIFRHQKYPYSKTLEYIHNKTDIKENLYNIIFSYQNARAKTTELIGSYHANWNFSGFQQQSLAVHVMDINDDGIIQINYDYLVSMFNEKEIEYLHERIMSIVDNAMYDINTKVKDINIMSENEKNMLLNEFNNTKMDYPSDKSVIQLFEEQVKNAPNNIALVFEEKEMTYRELNEKANVIANFLIAKGIKNNDIVALLLKRGFEMIIAILGVLKASAAYLPIDLEFPKDRIKYMLEDSNAKLILSNTDENYDTNKTIKLNSIQNSNIGSPNLKNNLEDLMYVIYTSGSTGKPKGAMISNGSATNFIFASRKAMKLQEEKDYTFISFSTYSFDIFLLETMLGLTFSNKIVLTNSDEHKLPNLMSKIIEKNNVNVMCVTPTRLQLLLNDKKYSYCLKNLSNLMLGGETFPKNIINKIKTLAKDVIIVNGYGPTEITIWSSVKEVKNESDITLGPPVGNAKVYILDSNNRLLPTECEGEICVGGKGVGLGYCNNIELTNKKYINFNGEKVYKTGDLGKIDFRGEANYLGRIDSQVKFHGLRIELEEIESTICKFSNILQVAVIIKNNILYGYFTSNIKIDIGELKKYLYLLLPRYMVPTKIINIDKFEIKTSGKINKDILLAMDYDDIENKEEFIPKTKIEKDITEIIKKSINCKVIYENTNFIELGIDSLAMVNIILEIDNKYNVELLPRDFMNSNNIEELCNVVQNLEYVKNDNIKKVTEKDIYNLSLNQLRIFAIYSSDPNSTLYNIPVELKLSKNINKEKIIESINKVILNNNIFRFQFDIINGQPIFRVNDNFKIDVLLKDVNEKEYNEIKNNFVKPFDLVTDKLFKIELYSTEKNIYMLFDAHHIIFDGVSMNIFLDELQKEYNDEKVVYGKNEFERYLCEVEDIKQTDKYEKAREYFIEAFKTKDDLETTIITDYDRKKIRTYNGDKYKLKVDNKLTKKIKQIAKNKNITYNSIFLGALSYTLSKYNYKDDIILGTVTSGRNNIKDRNAMGMYVNTIPYLNCIDYSMNIDSYLTKIQNDIMNLIENDIYQIDDLAKELSFKNIASRNLLFDIMYVYQNTSNATIKLGKENVNISGIDGNISKFDIMIQVLQNEKSDKFEIEYEFNTDLYKKETIREFNKNYLNCLEQLSDLNNLDEKLKDIDMVNKEDIDKILNVFNDTKKEYPSDKTIKDIFEKQVEKTPNNIAIVFEKEQLTYSELNEKANVIANILTKNGYVKNDVIAIIMKKSIELLPCILGILKIGGVYLPIDNELPDDRIKYMLENSNAKVILSKRNSYKKVNELNNIYIGFNEDMYSNNIKTNPKTVCNGEDLAYIMYTSGSTGTPKGVMITNKNVLRLIINNNFVKVSKDDKVLLTGSIVFDATTFEYYIALFNGLPLYIIKNEDLLNPLNLKDALDKNDITIMWLTAPLFSQIAEFDSTMFFKLKYLLVGGDVLAPKSIYKVKKSCPKLNIINGYGPTENTTFSVCFNIDKEYSKIPLGYVIQNSKGYIVDKTGKLCDINMPGELLVGGDGVGKGYVNREDLTKKQFIDDYISNNGKIYKTGDLCYFDKVGRVNFLGRIDSQVKIRGFRVELDEIKNKIDKIKEIDNSHVIIKEHNNIKYICAYYTSKFEISNREIKEKLEKVLPKYMMPTYFFKIENIPLNQNGKVDKTKLPEIEDKERDIIELPKTDIQKKLYQIWQEVLVSSDFSIDDDFFEIGGDSLLANQIVIKAIASNIKMTYADIFKYSTIRKMANYISNDSEEESRGGIESKYILKKMNEYNYKKYDEILALQNKNIEYKENEIKNILLTGATGFLGAHIIDSIIKNTNSNIYCIVRDGDSLGAKERFKNNLVYFFGKGYLYYIDKRIFVLEADLTEPEVNDKIFKYESIFKNIDVIIHSAARVKHFGKIDPFIDINMIATENLVKISKKYNIKFVHISTLSVSGNVIEGGNEQQLISERTEFSESDLYIGQNLTNVYARTKFEAEKIVLNELLNGLDGCIIRVGNLTGRLSDGKFQPNVEENAFSNRLKSMIDLKIIPLNLTRFYVEFTPIDICADAIIKLIFGTNFKNRIFHLFNDNHIDMNVFLDYLKDYNIDIKRISNEEFADIITNLTKGKNAIVLNGIIGDLNKEKQLNYVSNIVINEAITKNILEKLKFEWPNINKSYILKYIDYLLEIGFIRLK